MNYWANENLVCTSAQKIRYQPTRRIEFINQKTEGEYEQKQRLPTESEFFFLFFFKKKG